MKCEYCELRRIGPFAIPKSCTILSGKLLNKQTGEPLKNLYAPHDLPGSVHE